MNPLTRTEIMKALPEIKPGSFWYLVLQAEVKALPGVIRNGRHYRLFEPAAIKKIHKLMEGKRHGME